MALVFRLDDGLLGASLQQAGWARARGWMEAWSMVHGAVERSGSWSWWPRPSPRVVSWPSWALVERRAGGRERCPCPEALRLRLRARVERAKQPSGATAYSLRAYSLQPTLQGFQVQTNTSVHKVPYATSSSSRIFFPKYLSYWMHLHELYL